MATNHNFRIKNGLEVGGVLIVNSSGQLQATNVSGNLSLADNVQLRLGDSNEFQIYHTSSGNSIISETGGGSLYLDGSNIYLRKSTASGEAMADFVADGAVTLYHNGSAKIATLSSGIDVTGEIQINDSNTKLLEGSGNTVKVQTNSGYLEIGPANTSHAHLQTDRSSFYFNKRILVNEGVVSSYDEDLILRRAEASSTGQVKVERGRFRGESQTATDLLNSSMILGGFHANSAFEETSGHFYIPGLSPNNLAGAHRRLNVTVKKNGTTQSGDFSRMFSADGTNTSFSHAAGTTDTIEITITGIAMSYGQHVGVQFGHPTFRAKDIEIEVSTDNGSNWTSVYDVTNFPHATVSHYHGGGGTQTNAIRFTFTNFNNTGMRINQLFCYDYSENEIYFAEKNQDQLIRGHWTWTDNYEARFGSSGDLKIYHDGTSSYIVNTTNDLVIQDDSRIRLRTPSLMVNNAANTENLLTATENGAVTLFYNNSAKLATKSDGVDITGELQSDSLDVDGNADISGSLDVGNVTSDGHISLNQDNGTLYLGAGSDLRLFHDGNNSFINNTTATAGALSLKSHDINLMSTGSENMAKFEQDGPVRLYHDNAQKLMTLSTGVNITGDLEVSGNLNIAGDINSTSVTTLDVTDLTITVANNAGSASNANNAGLIVDTGGTNPSLLYKSSGDKFEFNKPVNFAGGTPTVAGNTVLTSNAGINANNINAGTVPNARLSSNVVQTNQLLVREETYTGSTNYGTNNTWHTLFTLDENSSPVLMYLKSAAHSSALVSISRGYFGNNTANINVLNSTYTQNGSYPGVTEIRVAKNSSNAYLVQVKLSWTASSVAGFALYVRLIGGTEAAVVPVLNSTIPTDSTSHTQVAHVYTNSTYSSFSTTPRVSNNVIWHAGNDGSGSTLDADTVDGIQGASFLRSDATDTASGALTFTGSILSQGHSAGDNWMPYTDGNFYFRAPNVFFDSSTNVEFNDEARVVTGSIAASNTTKGLMFDGNYQTGQYRHRWRKQDKSGGLPLYLDSSEGTANSYTEQVRFGSYTGASHKFEVYGNAKVDNLDVSSEGSTSQITIGKYDSTDQGLLYLTGSTANKQAVLRCTNGNLHIDANAGNNTYINYYTGSGTYFGGGAGNVVAVLGSDGDLWKGSGDNLGSKYWHAGNDGAGSGLDADLLDGIAGDRYIYGTDSLGAFDSNTFAVNPPRMGFFNINNSSAENPAGFGYWQGLHFRHNNQTSTWGWQLAGTYNTSYPDLYWRQVASASRGSWYKLWHTGNDGSGSGLDADTLDGINSPSLLRSDASDTFGSTSANQYIRFNCNSGQYIASGGSSSRFPIEIFAPTANGGDAGITFHISNDYAGFFGLASDTNDLAWGGWSVGSTTKYRIAHTGNFSSTGIWYSGNDGAGSGLDADTLDGQQGTNYKRNNDYGSVAEFGPWYSTGAYVYDSTNGTRYFWNLLGTIAASSCRGQIEYEAKDDENYPHFVKGTIAFSGFNSGTSFSVQHDQQTADPFGVQVRVDTSRRIWIRTPNVDWAHYFRFRVHRQTNNFTVNTSWSTGSTRYDTLTNSVPPNSSNDIMSGQNLRATSSSVTGTVPSYSNFNYFGKVYARESMSVAGSTVFHTGNDGSGSGLDADTVDGIQGANFFRSDTTDSAVGFFSSTSIAATGDSGIQIVNGGRLGFDQTGTRSWTVKAVGGNLDFGSGDGNGNLRYNGNVIWHAGNDGSGSGLDADTVDGLQPSAMSVNAANESHMVTGSAFATTSSPSSVLEYQQASSISDTKLAPSGDWHNTIRMGHGNPYSYYSNTIALRMTGTGLGDLYTQTISNNNAQGWNKHWHANNDGSGSGLDADNLDGVTWADRTKVVGATYIAIHADNGRGIGFWNNAVGLAGSYAIAMSAHNGTGAGRVSGETTSDYNMYFKMSAGTNRGFVFKNGSTSTGGLDGAGNWRHIGKLETGQSAYLNQSGTNTTSYNTTHTHVIRSQGNNGNGGGVLIQNDRGNHSWGTVAEMRINTSGDSDNPTLLFSSAAEGTATWGIGYGYTDTNFRINRDHGHRNSGWGVAMMTLDRSGNATFAGNVTAYSDKRLKENIETIPNAVETVKKIRGVTFDWKESGDEGMGVIAQEIEEVPILKRLVNETPIDGASEFPQKNVAYGNMVGLLIEAIKEQQDNIEKQQEVINRLESEINNLKKEK